MQNSLQTIRTATLLKYQLYVKVFNEDLHYRQEQINTLAILPGYTFGLTQIIRIRG